MTEISVKLLLVGDTCVGKTSLLLQYTENTFPQEHGATIGVEYKIKMFQYRDFQIKLHIWDTAGQERFHSITNNFFHNADGILFVYDITNEKSFEGAKNWIKEAEEIGDYFKRIIIGNKCDLEEKRQVSLAELEQFANEENISFFETSAKDNINLKEVFNKIVELIFEDKDDEEILREYSVKKSSLSIASKATKNKNKSKDIEKCC